MTWIDHLRKFTKYIKIDNESKRILLVHPHFKEGKATFKAFLKSIKGNTYQGYTVEAIGFASIKGILIIRMIERFLRKLDNIEKVTVITDIETSAYVINVKFK